MKRKKYNKFIGVSGFIKPGKEDENKYLEKLIGSIGIIPQNFSWPQHIFSQDKCNFCHN